MQEMNGLEGAGFAILLAVFLWIAFVAIINLVTLAWRGTKFCVSQLAKVFSRSTCFLIVSMFGVFVNTSLADSKVVLTITDSGYFETTVDSLGVPQSAKIVKILDLRTGGNTPTDTPPPTVPDVPKREVEQAVVTEVQKQAAALADKQGSQALALVYDHALGAYADGTLTYEALWNVIKESSDFALSKSAAKDWSQPRTRISQLADERKRTYGTNNKAVFEKFLASVQAGLESSAGTIDLQDDVAFAIIGETNRIIAKHKKAATNVN